jgi:hypothetical protein
VRGQKVALAAAMVVLAASAFAAGRYVRPGPDPGAPAAAAATAAPVVRASFPPVSRFAKRPALGPIERYTAAVDTAHRDGLRVWIEADLRKRWFSGRQSFDEGVQRVAQLARRPGVVGVKIADELGYADGLRSPAEVSTFLHTTAVALRAAAPGKLILVDMIVPELGCMPGQQPPLRWATICAARARGAYPQLALTAVDRYLASGDVDALDLSTSILPAKTYVGWGADEITAQRLAWQEVERRGWGRKVVLHARRALAHPGSYQGGPQSTADELRTFVDVPLSDGAAAVSVWTWRQLYQGQINRLLDPGLRPNALWQGLRQRRADGAVLLTHFSPSSVEVSLDADLATIASVFTDVFVAAGTG